MLAKACYQNLGRWCVPLIALVLFSGCQHGLTNPSSGGFDDLKCKLSWLCHRPNCPHRKTHCKTPFHNPIANSRVDPSDRPALPGDRTRFLPVPTRNIFQPVTYLSTPAEPSTRVRREPDLEPLPLPLPANKSSIEPFAPMPEALPFRNDRGNTDAKILPLLHYDPQAFELPVIDSFEVGTTILTSFD